MCFSIGIVSLLNWYQYALPWHIFLIGIIFEFRQKGGKHPLIDFLFCIKGKRREEYFFWIGFVFNPFVDDWQKGGEDLSLYACLYACFLFLLGSIGIKFKEHV